ncbi:hypothetical protein ABZP36_022836 [Zizania latifolia]
MQRATSRIASLALCCLATSVAPLRVSLLAATMASPWPAATLAMVRSLLQNPMNVSAVIYAWRGYVVRVGAERKAKVVSGDSEDDETFEAMGSDWEFDCDFDDEFDDNNISKKEK